MSADRRERIVVVGTGAAGLRAAERLRELNFDGELIMISEERYRPYHRPALTKQLLTGQIRPRDIALPVHTELDAVWRYGTRASYLEPEEHLLHLPGGEQIRYDGLVIATGVQARHLAGAPRHDPRVHVIRTLPDAVAAQKAIAHSPGAVAVIGGGFISCEIASSARELGREATIIVRDRLLDKVPGAGFGDAVAAMHRGHGVKVITQATVSHWSRTPDGVALHLSTGQVVLAACVVLGVGGVPAVDWLRGSGLILDDGVMCDPTCHAVGAENIVVAGDVARWPNLLFDSVPRRVEHWLNAIEMGRAAAENLLVGRENAQPFTPLPRFWSDQHGIRIQAAGIPALAQDTVPLAGSVTVGHRVTGYVSGGSLVGVVAWDSPRGMLRWSSELDNQLAEGMNRRLAVRAKQQQQRPVPTPPRPEPTFAETETTIMPTVTETTVMPNVDVTSIMEDLRVPDFVPDMRTLRPAEQSMPRMRPVQPGPYLQVPDFVPDMQAYGPAEQSWPRMRPVAPPPDLAMAKNRYPPDYRPRAPELRDLFR
ncbi:MAG TPA: FAD/NAD(P)-binding oxidoreductase [Actinophytocola sp.]|jgi:NADPH-dependent 2,4-dienoyl-CoA reductase/sulfur reductase-like enzyme|uniref:NAD(P)/FAD-dependent oxidoreductase n=1 Tax=Actinophytocola sp. TaxID=1872138 RepID=UPI002E0A3D78|nr:FAD/NAD(P)-binding oxidoreductase [Actinophytocola sp.]